MKRLMLGGIAAITIAALPAQAQEVKQGPPDPRVGPVTQPMTTNNAPPAASSTAAQSRTGDSATAGSAGTATAGGTSASSVGVGATSGDASALGVGASAAGGRTQSLSHVSGNGRNGLAKGQAMDHGTFSKSMTHTRNHKGQVYSRTRTMAHTPGSKPVMSTSSTSSPPTSRPARAGSG